MALFSSWEPVVSVDVNHGEEEDSDDIVVQSLAFLRLPIFLSFFLSFFFGEVLLFDFPLGFLWTFGYD